MSNSIGSVTSGALQAPAVKPPTTPDAKEKASSQPPPAPAQPAGASTGTTVQISVSSQVRNLQQQGLTAAQIARKLNISVNKVNSYLGTGNSTTTAAPAPAQTSSTTEEATESPAAKAKETNG